MYICLVNKLIVCSKTISQIFSMRISRNCNNIGSDNDYI
jgi:hypothetical protein